MPIEANYYLPPIDYFAVTGKKWEITGFKVHTESSKAIFLDHSTGLAHELFSGAVENGYYTTGATGIYSASGQYDTKDLSISWGVKDPSTSLQVSDSALLGRYLQGFEVNFYNATGKFYSGINFQQDGSIQKIDLLSGGSGYVNPTVVITGAKVGGEYTAPSGTGANIRVRNLGTGLHKSGSILSMPESGLGYLSGIFYLDIVSGGSGYTQDTVLLVTGSGDSAQAGKGVGSGAMLQINEFGLGRRYGYTDSTNITIPRLLNQQIFDSEGERKYQIEVVSVDYYSNRSTGRLMVDFPEPNLGNVSLVDLSDGLSFQIDPPSKTFRGQTFEDISLHGVSVYRDETENFKIRNDIGNSNLVKNHTIPVSDNRLSNFSEIKIDPDLFTQEDSFKGYYYKFVPYDNFGSGAAVSFATGIRIGENLLTPDVPSGFRLVTDPSKTVGTNIEGQTVTNTYLTWKKDRLFDVSHYEIVLDDEVEKESTVFTVTPPTVSGINYMVTGTGANIATNDQETLTPVSPINYSRNIFDIFSTYGNGGIQWIDHTVYLDSKYLDNLSTSFSNVQKIIVPSGNTASGFIYFTGNEGYTTTYIADNRLLSDSDGALVAKNINNKIVTEFEPKLQIPSTREGGQYSVKVRSFNFNNLTSNYSAKKVFTASGNSSHFTFVPGQAQLRLGGTGDITVNGDFATTVGGSGIVANGKGIVVVGGMDNRATGEIAALVGGSGNRLIGNVGDPQEGHFLGGGALNTGSGQYTAMVGGFRNSAQAHGAFLGGGIRNYIPHDVAGNDASVATAYSLIGGGLDNTVSGLASIIVGGNTNKIGTNVAIGETAATRFVADGINDSSYSTIVGGQNNEIYAPNSFIGGGLNNIIFGASFADKSNILGGSFNIVSGVSSTDGSAILAGTRNKLINAGTALAGGSYSSGTADNTFAFGAHSWAAHKGAFVLSDSLTPSADTDGTVAKKSHGTNTLNLFFDSGVYVRNGDVFISGDLTVSGSSNIGGGGGGAVTAVANGADNRVATFSSSSALNGEANLTFDGTQLLTNGNVSGLSGYFGKVGIGTSIGMDPVTKLLVSAGNGNNNPTLDLVEYSAGASDYAMIRFKKSDNNTEGTKSTTDTTDVLGSIVWQGVNTAGGFGAGSQIKVTQKGSAGSTYIPAQVQWFASNTSTHTGVTLTLDGADGYGHISDHFSIGGSASVDPHATLMVDGDASITGELRTDNLYAGGVAGIGIAPSSHQLEVYGGSYNSNLKLKGGGAAVGIQFADNDDNTDGYIYAAGTNIGFLDAGADWMVRCVNDQFIRFATNGDTQHMRVSSDGKVLIGEGQDATALLTVSGNASITGELRTNGNLGVGTPNGGALLDPLHISAGNPRIRLEDTLDTNNYSRILADNGQLTLSADEGNNQASSAIIFKVDNGEVMRMNGANVGIGTTNPGAKLTVYDGADSKLEVDPANNRIRLRDHTYVSGNLYISGSVVAADGTSPDHVSGLSGYFGKVGIGTSNMDSSVNLLVDGYALGAGAAGGGEVRLRAADGSYFTHFNQNGIGNHTISMVNGGATVFRGSPSRPSNDILTIRQSAVYGLSKVSIGSQDMQWATFNVSGNASITGELQVGGQVGILGAPSYSLDVNAAGSQTIRVKSTNNHAAVRIDRPSESYDSNLMFQTAGATKWRLAQGVVVDGAGNDSYLSIYDDINNVGHTTFKAGGNVGIGTSEPSGRLHVRAGSMGPMTTTVDSRYNLVVEDNGENYIGMYAPTNSYNGIRFNDQLGLDGYIDYYHGTAGDCLVYSAGNHHKFQIGSAEEMRLTANSLIINTEGHFNTDNHGAMLVVSGDASITGELKTDGNVGINADPATHSDTAARNLVIKQDSGGGGITISTATNAGGSIYFADGNSSSSLYRGYLTYNHTIDTMIIGAAAVTQFAIDATATQVTGELRVAGNVGIGVAPEDKLHVGGNIMITDTSPELTFETSNSSHYNWQIAAQENTSAAMEFSVGSADADASNDTFSSLMTILQGGNVGIGTTSPQALLQVDGDASITGELRVNRSGLFVGGSSTSNALVGVGTTSPQFTLDVQFPNRISANAEYAWGLDLRRPGSTSRGLSFGADQTAADWVIGSHNANLRFGHTFGLDAASMPKFYEDLSIFHQDQTHGGGKIGIGDFRGGTPQAKLVVSGDASISGELAITEKIVHGGDTNTFIRFTSDKIEFEAGGLNFITLNENDSQDEIVINDGGVDMDFRVEGDSNANALFIQASTNRVSIGHSSAEATFDVNGDAVVRGNLYFDGVSSSYIDNVSHELQLKGAAGVSLFTHVSAGWIERLTVTDPGDVGIGTILPSGILHAENNSTGIIVANNQITGNAFEVFGAQGNLLTVTDDLSDSLFSVNDAAGMPVFEVFADDTIKSYRNNESKFEINPENNRIRLRDNTYVSGNLYVSGSVIASDGTSPDHVSGLSGYFGKVGVGSTSIDALTDGTSTRLQVSHPGESFAVNLKAAGTSYIPNLALSSDRPSSNQEMGKIKWLNNGATPVAQIKAIRGSSDTVGHLNFQTCNAHAMQIWSDQRVQIASTQHVAPQATLVVSGDASVTGELKIGDSSFVKGNFSLHGVNSPYLHIDGSVDAYARIDRGASNRQAYIAFQTAGSENWVVGVPDSDNWTSSNGGEFYIGQNTDAENVAPALVIDETNNYVGIGDFRTAMPQAMLTVSGDASITGELRANKIKAYQDGSSHGVLEVHTSPNVPTVKFNAIGGSSYIENGKFGVGMGVTVSPQATLHVNGDASVTGEFRTAGNVGINTVPTGRMHIYQSGDSQPAFLVEGSQGSLFSVEDTLTGSLMSVNDIAGLPVFEAFDDGAIVMGQYNSGDLVVTGNNVGIGTAVPVNQLHVHGKADGFGYIRITDGNVGATATDGCRIGYNSSALRIQNYENSNISFFTNNTTEALTIQNDGNIGIGTTNPESFSNYTAVTVSNSTGGQIYFKSTTSSVTAYAGADSNGAYFASKTNHPLRLRTNNTDKLFIEADGNVGIGTTSPDTEFHIVGNRAGYNGTNNYAGVVARITNLAAGTPAGNTAGLEFGVSAGTNASARIDAIRQSDGSIDMRFFGGTTSSITGASPQMYIDGGNGKVGIGTTNPTAKLTVDGTASISGELRVDGTLGVGGAPIFKLQVDHSDQDGLMLKTANTAESFINFSDGDDNDVGQISYDHAFNHMGFRVAAAERFKIDSTATQVTGDLRVAGDAYIKEGDASANLYIETYDTDAGPSSTVYLRKSDNDTVGTVAQTDSGDYLGSIVFQGVNGAGTPAFFTSSYISAIQNGAAGSTYVPSDLIFATSTDSALAEQMRITKDGDVGIGTANPHAKLQVNGDASITGELKVNSNIFTANKIGHLGDANTYLSFGGDTLDIIIGSQNMLSFDEDSTQDEVVVNEDSADIDFRCESNNNTHMLLVDAANDLVGIGTSTPSPSYTLTVNGGLAADYKSFIIDHPDPAKPDKQLAYASSETPEHNVFVRGKAQSKIIELPDHWPYLVHEDSISAQLTPIGEHQELYVESIKDNKILINNSKENKINCFYLVHAERKDIGKLEIEPNKSVKKEEENGK